MNREKYRGVEGQRDLTDEGEGRIRHRRRIVTGIRWYRRLQRYRVGDIGGEFGRHDLCGEKGSVSGFGAEGELQYPRIRHSCESLGDYGCARHRELRLLREQRYLRHLRHLRLQHRAQSGCTVFIGCPEAEKCN